MISGTAKHSPAMRRKKQTAGLRSYPRRYRSAEERKSRAEGVGAQIYICSKNAKGGLEWTFREPITPLMADGKTIGHHFADPVWVADGFYIADGDLPSEPYAATYVFGKKSGRTEIA